MLGFNLLFEEKFGVFVSFSLVGMVYFFRCGC